MDTKNCGTATTNTAIDFVMFRRKFTAWLDFINFTYGRGKVLDDTYKITVTHRGTRANGTITTRWITGNGKGQYKYGSIRFDVMKGVISAKMGRQRCEKHIHDLI